jgi:hypothetical protein
MRLPAACMMPRACLTQTSRNINMHQPNRQRRLHHLTPQPRAPPRPGGGRPALPLHPQAGRGAGGGDPALAGDLGCLVETLCRMHAVKAAMHASGGRREPCPASMHAPTHDQPHACPACSTHGAPTWMGPPGATGGTRRQRYELPPQPLAALSFLPPLPLTQDTLRSHFRSSASFTPATGPTWPTSRPSTHTPASGCLSILCCASAARLCRSTRRRRPRKPARSGLQTGLSWGRWCGAPGRCWLGGDGAGENA